MSLRIELSSVKKLMLSWPSESAFAPDKSDCETWVSRGKPSVLAWVLDSKTLSKLLG